MDAAHKQQVQPSQGQPGAAGQPEAGEGVVQTALPSRSPPQSPAQPGAATSPASAGPTPGVDMPAGPHAEMGAWPAGSSASPQAAPAPGMVQAAVRAAASAASDMRPGMVPRSKLVLSTASPAEPGPQPGPAKGAAGAAPDTAQEPSALPRHTPAAPALPDAGAAEALAAPEPVQPGAETSLLSAATQAAAPAAQPAQPVQAAAAPPAGAPGTGGTVRAPPDAQAAAMAPAGVQVQEPGPARPGAKAAPAVPGPAGPAEAPGRQLPAPANKPAQQQGAAAAGAALAYLMCQSRATAVSWHLCACIQGVCRAPAPGRLCIACSTHSSPVTLQPPAGAAPAKALPGPSRPRNARVRDVSATRPPTRAVLAQANALVNQVRHVPACRAQPACAAALGTGAADAPCQLSRPPPANAHCAAPRLGMAAAAPSQPR